MGWKESERGFTLIELLIVVAIIAILAAIAIPNLLTAINRSKQKRTISDMRNIATAWESQAIESSSYTAAAATFPWPAETVTPEQLNGLLVPHYIKNIPDRDGWGGAFDFASDQPIGSSGQTYAIRSFGWGGEKDGDTYEIGLASDFSCDIVYSDGAFIAYPQAAMKN